MSEETTTNKTWSTVGEYRSYDIALRKKEEISERFDLVKIRRGTRTKNQKREEVFRVKAWSKPAPTQKKKKKAKKGSK